MSKKITQHRLKELLDYNPDTGIFTRKIKASNNVNIDDVAGYEHLEKCGKKYRNISINGKQYKAHRLVWLYVYGKFPENQIDHINGAGLDNRISNLREAAHGENQKNARLRHDNTSGVSGVCLHKRNNKWSAMIRVGGKRKHLGYFVAIVDAIIARKMAEYEYGFHANHGSCRPL